MIQIRAVSIGADALRLSATCQTAQVNGITSRGIFLLTQDRQVLFISFEGWRGPWTVNLTSIKALEPPKQEELLNSDHLFLKDRLSIGSRVSLHSQGLYFSVEDIEIVFDHREGWLDIPLSYEELDWFEIGSRLQNVIDIVIGASNNNGWIGLLNPKGHESKKLPDDLAEVKEILNAFSCSLNTGGGNIHADKFHRILGRGTGLTPSGDDVVIGILLALRRSGLWKTTGLYQDFAASIVHLARQVTTSLGSCLIASAAKGQADERLLSALDGILFGDLYVKDCAERLQAYGSSSGGDTLLGMYAALKGKKQ